MLTKITLKDGLYSKWNDMWMTRYCKLLCYSISVVMVLFGLVQYCDQDLKCRHIYRLPQNNRASHFLHKIMLSAHHSSSAVAY